VTSDSRSGHHHRTLTVGLTGGIASGKSTAAAQFAELGIPIIDTDQISREIVNPASETGRKTLDRLRHMFGDAIIQADGQLDRACLRAKVFGTGESFRRARHELEAIMHPAIHDKVQRQVALHEGTVPYVLIVIPLLAEPATRERYSWLDRIVTVAAPEALRHERLCQRPGIDATTADAMIAAQSNERERRRIADYILDNQTSLAQLRQQVDAVDRQLRTRTTLSD